MQNTLPNFSKLNYTNVKPELKNLIDQNKSEITKLLKNTTPNFNNFVLPIEQLNENLHRYFSPYRHVNSVLNPKELTDVYPELIELLTDYSNFLSHNPEIYANYKKIQADKTLTQEQKALIDLKLQQFRLSGAELSASDKEKWQKIETELHQLEHQFEKNLLEATNSWTYIVEDEAELKGLSTSQLALLQENAKQRNLKGYCLSLDEPSYLAVITYAENPKLREKIYHAMTTRASELFWEPKYDNSEIMQEILKRRKQLSQLLEFNNFADYALANKMAKTSQNALQFLQGLAEKSQTKAQKDLESLNAFAQTIGIATPLAASDIAYVSEKMRAKFYHIDDQLLRPYFPLPKVLSGLFSIVNQLFSIEIKPVEKFDSWHPDVKLFAVYKNQQLIAHFYCDFFARHNKRSGAWMDECYNRCLDGNSISTPVTFLTCNFMPATENKPALLNHDEVLTLFHEFGHSLQHMLTQIDYPSIAGINGICWDAVEFPSQFLENWVWQKESLKLISAHYETGESLPEHLFNQLIASRTFLSGLYMVRQLEFSLFDLRLHREFDENQINQIQTILDEVRDQIAVVKPPKFNRFQHSFSHIFAGGYAASYYSYKWAEVLAQDGFSLFEEKGIFNAELGESYYLNILASGASDDPETLFIRFRGRKPEQDALLRTYGLC